MLSDKEKYHALAKAFLDLCEGGDNFNDSYIEAMKILEGDELLTEDGYWNCDEDII